MKLNISDTANMLNPYLRKVDTASLSNRINLKVNISDTASMLNPYLRKVDTASLSNRINLKLNISDTASMLSPYLRKIDTASLSNRINTKLNISDTSTMLGNYVNNVGYGLSKVSQVVSADSATLASYFLRRKDSLTATNLLGYVTGKILADTAAAIRAAAGGGSIGGSGTINRLAKFTASGTIGNSSIADSSSSVAMTISSAGNVGLGVVPGTWNASVKAIQISGASIYAASNFTNLSSNTIWNVNKTYIANGFASEYAQENGEHRFFTAPSGTAGNNISYTQAMTLNASGNLGLGTTTIGSRLQVNGNAAIGYSASTAAPTNGLAVAGNAGFGIAAPTFVDGSGIHINNASGASRIRVTNNTTGTASSDGSEFTVDGNDLFVVNRENASTSFWTNNTERARLDSIGTFFIGNGRIAGTPTLGIISGTGGTGTNIAGAELRIRGGASTGNAAGGPITFYTSAAGSSGSTTNTATERMRINAAGNVGINSTPSAWNTLYRVLEIGNFALMGTGSTDAADLYYNLFLNASSQFIYKTSTTAGAYSLANGQHRWYNVPSGTAGAVATLTQAMTLDASNNLGIGTTTIGSRLQVNGNAAIGYSASTAAPTNGLAVSGNVGIGTTSPETKVQIGTTSDAENTLTFKSTATGTNKIFFSDGTGAALYAGFLEYQHTGNNLLFGTNSAERMRITSGGQVGIGTTTFNYNAVGRGQLALSGSTDAILEFQSGTTSRGYFFANAANFEMAAPDARFINFSTNGSERMRITSDGNVFVGATSSAYTAANRTVLTVNGTNQALIGLMTGGTNRGYFYSDGTNVLIYSEPATGYMAFGTANAERMRITSGGEMQLKPATNTAALTTSGAYSLTGSNAQSLIDLAGTWNTTGNPTAIKLNITNTASGASADLMELQVGGTNQFRVTKGGAIETDNPTTGTKKPWKLGSVMASSMAYDATRYIEVEVDGTLYYLALSTLAEPAPSPEDRQTSGPNYSVQKDRPIIKPETDKIKSLEKEIADLKQLIKSIQK